MARCPNPYCPAQRIGGLLHFTGRGGMDVDGLGYKIMIQLAERDLVREPADIFKLDVETLEGLDRLGRKSAENLHAASIEAARHRPLSRILNALGIRHVGWTDRHRPGRLARAQSCRGPRARPMPPGRDAPPTSCATHRSRS